MHLRLQPAIYALGVAAAMVGAIAPARALVHFDFEGPYLVDPGHTIKDHALVREGAIYHCYYIRGTEGSGTSSERELGHAVSTDLRTWTVLAPAVAAGPTPWDARNVWAPAVIHDPPPYPGQVLMLYTGANQLVVQRTGQATSGSLFGPWLKPPSNPWLQPDSTAYLWNTTTSFSAFRDPFYFNYGGLHHLLHTVEIPNGAGGRRGAIHHLTSPDFVSWTDVGPLLTHNGPANVSWHELESVQLHHAVGYWHLFYSETNELGIRYLRNTSMDSGWDLNQASTFDLGVAPEVNPAPGQDRWIFTRHVATQHLYDGSLFWVLVADSLYFHPTLGVPVKIPTNVLAGDWPVISGTSFVAAPTFGDNSRERGETPTNPTGHGYIGSAEFFKGPLSGYGSPGSSLGPEATGSMKSRVFTITGTHIDLRVGGGDDPECYVALVDAANDQVLRSASGMGTPALQEVRWPVYQLMGRQVYLTIQDGSMAPGGYINVDDIREVQDVTAVPQPGRPDPGARPRLLPNQPNPFNPRTTLRVVMPTAGVAELALFDARGRRVATLLRGWLAEGTHALQWDGRDTTGDPAASGVYRAVLCLDDMAVDSRSITLAR